MSKEPEYVAQTAEEKTASEKRAWFMTRAREASAEKGCTWFRYAQHTSDPDLILIEGWVERPENEGALRWSMVKEQV